MGEILPEAAPARLAAAAALEPPVPEAQLAVLLADAPNPKPALERLKLPVRTVERALVLIRQQRPPAADAPGKAVRLWVRDAGPEHLDEQLSVSAALGHDVAVAPRAHAAAKDPLVPKQLALDGRAIMTRLATGPGPRVGDATRFLMDAVLDEPALNSPDALLALLDRFAAQKP